MSNATTTLAVIGALLVVSLAPFASAANFSSPSVSITPSPIYRQTVVNYTATFNNNGCGTPTFAWVFGNGGTATTPSPATTHTFSTLGTFAGSVTVSGSGCTSKSGSFSTVVVNRAPTATLAPITDAVAGSPFTLSATAADLDGTIVRYVFHVDGTEIANGTASSAQATLVASGAHIASLSVFDNNGATAASSVSFGVSAASLHRVVTTGSAADIVVASTRTFAAAGFDAYGNAVALPSSSFEYTAPTTAGPAQACYDAANAPVNECVSLLVVAGPLHHIVVSGPSSLVAGTSATYDLAGFDAYENTVDAGATSFPYDAPTSAGPAQACYTVAETEIADCADVDIVSAALDHIVVSGPSTLVAGTSATYDIAGFDAYGNAVDAGATSFTYDAPTTAGPASACWTAAPEGIEVECADLSVVADVLDSITVTGPASMAAGTSAEFTASGADQYGNSIALEQGSFSFTAPDAVGAASACYEESGVEGCADVDVVAAGLDSISVTGPASMVAGTSADYDVAGFDAYGNVVALGVTAFSFAAPQTAGDTQACYAEGVVEGCADVSVVADGLDSVAVSGPASLAAGETGIYLVSGFDQYDNPVGLTVASFEHIASTTAGADAACYEESGVEGCQAIDVVAGPLATLVVSGPATMVAGETATFTVAGSDIYGNDVVLESSSFLFAAPQQVGPAQACAIAGDVEDCADVSVVADVLHHILVEGPASLAAGESAPYDVAGFDQYDNAVALAIASFDFQAPTVAGATEACYDESSVIGCADVTVVADALDRISVEGPASLVAGKTGAYDVAGFDQYDNAVALAVASFDLVAPTAAGPTSACYAEGDVEGCASLDVVADALASIAIGGPASLAAGTTGTFPVTGADQYGNAVALLDESVSHTAGQTVGNETISYTELGVTGTKTIAVTAVPLVVNTTMTKAVYTPGALLLDPPMGTVLVSFPGSGALTGANVTVTITRTTPLGPVGSESFSGSTNETGAFGFAPSALFSVPGSYVVTVSVAAFGHVGEGAAAYRVGL